ncbi:MAG TPA: DNA-processing protein DprA [Rubrivivax sp.]|nr:DNA-processing protein DprA [Rubrivivax sp.]
MLDADEFDAWFRLLQTPGLGREGVRRLLAGFGSAEQVLRASRAAWQQVVGAQLAEALATEPTELQPRLRAAHAWLERGERRQVLTVGDRDYPPQLLQSADPPLLLYVQGQVELLARRSLAIVGSRNASVAGLDNARAFGAHLSRQGWAIVSGLALGIDGAAHEGGLQGAGSTIAVVGTGLDRVYPARHRELARRIAEAGALVSEFAPGTPPLPENFPLRNRIIAGLSRGTLVVEAALQSGSLITARLAAENGREVFAVPGSIHSPLSRGCHALIRQGAKLVENAGDLLEELQASTAAPASAGSEPAQAPPPAARRDPVLEALGHDPATLDALCARTGFSAQRLSARLLELELEDQVARLPGGLYQRRSHV